MSYVRKKCQGIDLPEGLSAERHVRKIVRKHVKRFVRNIVRKNVRRYV